MNHLLCLGYGFSAQHLAAKLIQNPAQLSSWKIFATSRSSAGLAAITAAGHSALTFSDALIIPADVSHVLISAPPDANGDPVLRLFEQQLKNIQPQWLGYLSTTGVYGDQAGGWVDEETPLKPTHERGQRRLAAEQAWLATGLGPQIFRLAGIYGPGRNALATLLSGRAQRIIKPGQIFSRIHVEDIAETLLASIRQPNPGRAYNLCDDEPCPPQDVITYAAELLNMSPPPEVAFADANLSPMARSFYAESKRVSNQRIKSELKVTLRYPTYREGLQALLAEMKN